MTCPDYSGTSPFHLCLQESATECLAISLQLLPVEILAVPHPQFLLPLLHAAQLGNKEACQLLVRAGADVNQVSMVAQNCCPYGGKFPWGLIFTVFAVQHQSTNN